MMIYLKQAVLHDSAILSNKAENPLTANDQPTKQATKTRLLIMYIHLQSRRAYYLVQLGERVIHNKPTLGVNL
jgi:hypothetical protein